MRNLGRAMRWIWLPVVATALVPAAWYLSNRWNRNQDQYLIGGVEVTPQEFVERGGRCDMIRTSGGKTSEGGLASPSRDATVFVSSACVSRRSGALPGAQVSFAAPPSSLMPEVPALAKAPAVAAPPP